MWSVVCFLNDNTIGTVPDFWCKNGICSYPNKPSTVRKFIQRRMYPNELEFSKFKVELLYENVGLYTAFDFMIKNINYIQIRIKLYFR